MEDSGQYHDSEQEDDVDTHEVGGAPAYCVSCASSEVLVVAHAEGPRVCIEFHLSNGSGVGSDKDVTATRSVYTTRAASSIAGVRVPGGARGGQSLAGRTRSRLETAFAFLCPVVLGSRVFESRIVTS